MRTEVIDELIDPVSNCLTPDVARKIAALRASPQVQSRLDELAEKCDDGTLTPEERDVYESYVRAINFIGVLQAKARRVVAESSP